MSDVLVIVYSKGGNTLKVADAIADALNTKVIDLATSPPEDAKIMFLGSGTYGGKPGEPMMKFIASGTFTGHKVALFGTSSSVAGSQKMITTMADALKSKGASILGSYDCRGKFLLLNRSNPSKEDLDNAKKFAREMISIS
jgi:flavodoxin